MADTWPELGTHRVKRVTGIEPALSAWESGRARPLTVLTWASDAPLVTAMDPASAVACLTWERPSMGVR